MGASEGIMARFHIKGGDIKVPYTAAEEAERDAQEATWLDEAPMLQWKQEMVDSDRVLARINEDIIDTMSVAQKAKLPKMVQNNHAAKKALRGEKP